MSRLYIVVTCLIKFKLSRYPECWGPVLKKKILLRGQKSFALLYLSTNWYIKENQLTGKGPGLI